MTEATQRRFKPYPAYKDSGIEWLGQIPVSWRPARIKDLADRSIYYPLGDGDHGSIKPEHYVPDGIPYIRVQNLDWGFALRTEGLVHISASVHRANRKSHLRPGDILVAKTGATVGKTAIVPDSVAEANTTSSVGKLTVDRRLALARFAAYSIRSPLMQAQIWADASQKSAQPGFDIEDFAVFTVPLPPLEDQAAIVAFLDRETPRIDALVTKKERLIELLLEERTALVTRAVTNGLDAHVPKKDSGVQWFGAIPTHWEVKRLKDVVPGITVGIVVTPSKYYVTDGVPCLRSLNVSDGILNMAEVVFISPKANEQHRKSMIAAGDLVVVRTGRAGTALVVPTELDGANCIDLLIIRQSADIDSRFLYYLINSPATAGQVKAHSVGAIQEHYNTRTLAELWVPSLPLKEQKAIVEVLDRETTRIDTLIAKVRDAIDLLTELHTALISGAVTGKIDVREEVA